MAETSMVGVPYPVTAKFIRKSLNYLYTPIYTQTRHCNPPSSPNGIGSPDPFGRTRIWLFRTQTEINDINIRVNFYLFLPHMRGINATIEIVDQKQPLSRTVLTNEAG